MKCRTCKKEKSHHMIRCDYDENGDIICQCAVCWGMPQELEAIFLNAVKAIEDSADKIWNQILK